MSAVKTPQEKKRLSYARDHVVKGGESDKAFRRKWPLKKVKSKRAQRHKISAVLSKLQPLAADEAEAKTKEIKRSTICKWGVFSLKDRVTERRLRRVYLLERQQRQNPPSGSSGKILT